MSEQVMCTVEGSLSKWTNVVKGWQHRWFVLDSNEGTLSYSTSKEKMCKGSRRGCLRLNGATISSNSSNTFSVHVDSKVFHFQAKNEEDREYWVKNLEMAVLKLKISRDSSDEGPLSFQEYTHTFDASMAIYEKKILETDAYLQLVINKVNNIEKKKSTMDDPDDINRCNEICNYANCIIEQVKNGIVLLQLTKNKTLPVLNSCRSVLSDEGDFNGISVEPPLDRESTNMMIPSVSYSSSDNEEDYYDARGSLNSLNVPQKSKIKASVKMSAAEERHEPTQMTREARESRVYKNSDGSLNYDYFYNSNVEPTVDIEGSVVRHLLNQVKIGMDLTKVTLPTFCLERRSLLEMYADHFAHPNLFVSIADQPTPKLRMIQLVKWYLSSFHAGRKSEIAKKPYNPVLGETFICTYNIEGSSPLKFCAEQVSHHPPISAFYAEHFDNKISCDAHIWTKSKFLGLSIGVHNIGQGIITLHKLNESYTINFPSGYCRSILTVPWIELGGEVTIFCAQTGYRAVIEFLTKPFYGGKKNKITGSIFSPDVQAPLMTINGEWNGEMLSSTDGITEPFLDINRIKVYKKNVRPVSEQSASESRYLWRNVTASLYLNNLEAATEFKSEIEDEQRKQVVDRQNKGIQHTSKYFDCNRNSESCWFYNRVPFND